MNIQKLLTDHIDIWTAAETEKKPGRGRSSGNAGSVYGIKKLRELILELAVRGKLVPQDANDEPAGELLKRIQSEKAKLVAESKIKQVKPLPPIAEDEKSFDLPDGWTWIRLGEVCSYIQRGKGPTYAGNSEFLVISQKCVRWTGLDLTQARFIDPESVAKYEAIRFLCEGDILWNSTGTGTIGRACWVPSLLNQQVLVADSHVTVVRPIGLWNVFLWRWIQSPSVQSQIEGVASGTTNQIELNTSTVISHLLPLPPLAEQQRIVAKVDELMALCDQLETQHSNAAEAHEKLVSHLLGTLTQSPVRGELVEPHPSTSSGRTEFEDNWQRIAAHFDTLFTTEASIDALKQTILELAVMGKISSLQQSDTPMATLLMALAHEKKALRISKKDEDALASDLSIALNSIEYNRVKLKTGSFCDFITKGTTPSKSDLLTEGDIPFLKVYNIVNNQLDFDYRPTFISNKIHESKLNRSKIYPTDVIMNIVGPPLGKVAIISNQYPEWNMNQALAAFRPLAGIYNRYIYYMLSTGSILKSVLAEVKGTAGQDNLSLEQCRNLLIPIPSIEEQHRIVAKVDELMAICDQLKSRISESRQLQQKLADVLVEQAVSQ